MEQVLALDRCVQEGWRPARSPYDMHLNYAFRPPSTSVLGALDESAFSFQRQINHWIGLQESSNELGAGIEDDRTEKFDVRSLLLAQPKNMETELRFHKELFSKLKFNFLEQTTKETFLKRVLSIPPQWCTDEEVSESERKNELLKAKLKTFKTSTEEQKEALAELVNKVCEVDYDALSQLKVTADSLARNLEAQPTESELRQQLDELETPLSALKEQLDDSSRELSSLDAQHRQLESEVEALNLNVSDVKNALSNARQAASNVDPRMDAYFTWCEEWSRNLMALQNIASLSAVSPNVLRIELVASFGRNCVVTLTIPSDASGVFELETDWVQKIRTDDAIDLANRIKEASIREATEFLLGEVAQRLHSADQRLVELRSLEAVMGSVGLAAITIDAVDPNEIVLALSGGSKSVTLRLDEDYPNSASSIEVVAMNPKGSFVDLVRLQDLFAHENVTSLRDAVAIVTSAV
ncbi:hypothetical protein HK405_006293 [Cladochytrium tenue]|nr:hypothetical protein HK405_006293 [Cladochytrium tenue]